MTILDLIILLIVAAVCGSLGMAITGYSRGGCLMSIALVYGAHRHGYKRAHRCRNCSR